MSKILIVEDEESIRKLIRVNLEMDKYIVEEAESGEEALEKFATFNPDIALLDVMLPGMDGFQVCKILRSQDLDLGIIMLTAKSQDIDKIEGLESGADDYVAKPFNPKELILRIKSLERRVIRNPKEHEKEDRFIENSCFKLDKKSRKFYKNGDEIELTPTEYSVVKLFFENLGEAISRDEILDRIWGEDYIGDSKIVDVNIRRLRSKIEDDSSNPDYLQTVWGMGYIWEDLDAK